MVRLHRLKDAKGAPVGLDRRNVECKSAPPAKWEKAVHASETRKINEVFHGDDLITPAILLLVVVVADLFTISVSWNRESSRFAYGLLRSIRIQVVS